MSLPNLIYITVSIADRSNVKVQKNRRDGLSVSSLLSFRYLQATHNHQPKCYLYPASVAKRFTTLASLQEYSAVLSTFQSIEYDNITIFLPLPHPLINLTIFERFRTGAQREFITRNCERQFIHYEMLFRM